MQSSLAVQGNTNSWTLVNASPDIRAQLDFLRTSDEPHTSARNSQHSEPQNAPTHLSLPRKAPFESVVLIDAQLDHTLGLLSLREGTPLQIHCTPRVEQLLRNDLPTFRVLDAFCGVEAKTIPLNGTPFTPLGSEGVRFTAIPQGNKSPRYALTHRARTEPSQGGSPSISQDAPQSEPQGSVVALFLENESTGKSVLYAPALDAFGEALLPYVSRAHVLLLDGSFWHDDELEQAGISKRRARDMGHWPLGGDDGLIHALGDFPGKRIVLTHINNTNPILNEDSKERSLLNNRGIDVAHDGLDIAF